jgi:Mg2+/Co2+ transporter CorB
MYYAAVATADPVVWFVNLFVDALLALLRIKPPAGGEPQRLSSEELRSLELEAAHYIPKKHRSILVNLFELVRITVEDVMTPRAQIEAVDPERRSEHIPAARHQHPRGCWSTATSSAACRHSASSPGAGAMR